MIPRTVSFPHLLPNEHLLSVVARWFNQTGHNNFYEITKSYFKSTENLIPYVVWNTLYAEIAKHYQHSMCFEQLINDHTLLNYYRPFMSSSKREIFKACDLALDMDDKKYVTSRKLLLHVTCWRWCPDCVNEDTAEFGGSYWHTYHQIPTMLKCYRHDTTLLSSCGHCGFMYKGFYRAWLPPENNQCTKCAKKYEIERSSICSKRNWFESMSYYLQEQSSALSLDDLRRLMRAKIDKGDLSNYTSPRIRNELSRLNTHYANSIDTNFMSNYLKNPSKLLSNKSQLFNLTQVAYRDMVIPPLAIIIMLEYLGLADTLTRAN